MPLLCRLGFHDFPWPPHSCPWSLWEDFLGYLGTTVLAIDHVECSRGCGARRTRTCFRESHWERKHPEDPS